MTVSEKSPFYSPWGMKPLEESLLGEFYNEGIHLRLPTGQCVSSHVTQYEAHSTSHGMGCSGQGEPESHQVSSTNSYLEQWFSTLFTHRIT